MHFECIMILSLYDIFSLVFWLQMVSCIVEISLLFSVLARKRCLALQKMNNEVAEKSYVIVHLGAGLTLIF